MAELADTVHYVTSDIGPVECRAAIVTRTWDDDPSLLSLRVFGLVLEMDRAAYRVPHEQWVGPDTSVGTWHEADHGGDAS